MRFVFQPKHYAGIAVGIIIIIIDIILFLGVLPDVFGPKAWYFNPIAILAILIALSPFVVDFFKENKRQKELESKFLEFVRSLLGSVRSGVNVSQAIIQVSGADYGSLTPYVGKLAHQIEWGLPLHQTLTTFSKDTKNSIIERFVNIIIQSERSGGDIASVLESVTASTYEIRKVKEEQKATAYSQTIQGYIIYFVFIATMLVLQIFLIPRMESIGAEVAGGLSGVIGSLAASGSPLDFGALFIATVVVQGIFAGLMLGKFSDGDFRSGVKHSLVMCLSGYFIVSMVSGIIGSAGGAEVAAVTLLLFIPKRWFTRTRKE